MPQPESLNRLPVRETRPSSALNTPIWHQMEEITRIVVLTRAKGTLSIAVRSSHKSVETARMVKYMAKRPAKNMISLPSHTMVPTMVMLGRVAGPWVTSTGRSGAPAVAVVVIATRAIIAYGPARGTVPSHPGVPSASGSLPSGVRRGQTAGHGRDRASAPTWPSPCRPAAGSIVGASGQCLVHGILDRLTEVLVEVAGQVIGDMRAD